MTQTLIFDRPNFDKCVSEIEKIIGSLSAEDLAVLGDLLSRLSGKSLSEIIEELCKAIYEKRAERTKKRKLEQEQEEQRRQQNNDTDYGF